MLYIENEDDILRLSINKALISLDLLGKGHLYMLNNLPIKTRLLHTAEVYIIYNFHSNNMIPEAQAVKSAIIIP